MPEHFDILVVGSGPAGSAAAHAAATAGLRVGLVDKSAFPRPKLCGGLVTGRAMASLRAEFALNRPELFLETRHIRFLAGDQLLAERTDAPPMYLTQRWEFDAALHAKAISAGATPITGQPVREIDQSARSLILRDGTQLSYRCLIGADGVRSVVAKTLFGRAFDPKTIGFGYEVEPPHEAPASPAVEVDFTAAHWGYGWSFPKHNSQTIGVGGLKLRNPDMDTAMAHYADRHDAREANPKGHFLPFGDYNKTPGADEILLAGDAAGLVDPITGEGIALALESGILAAEAAIEALHADAPNSAYARYLGHLAPIHRHLAQAKRWRWLIFPKPMQPAFLRAFGSGSSMPSRYLQLLAGELSYDDLRGVFLRKIPKAAWYLMKARLP